MPDSVVLLAALAAVVAWVVYTAHLVWSNRALRGESAALADRVVFLREQRDQARLVVAELAQVSVRHEQAATQIWPNLMVQRRGEAVELPVWAAAMEPPDHRAGSPLLVVLRSADGHATSVAVDLSDRPTRALLSLQPEFVVDRFTALVRERLEADLPSLLERIGAKEAEHGAW